MQIKFKKLRPGAIIPKYATFGASGFDLAAAEDVIIYQKHTVVVPTGLAVELPRGFEMQIRPRSGLSLKTSLRMPNAPGTIDSDYRGEIGVILENTGSQPLTIDRGMRIAQGVIVPVERAEIVEVDELSETARGDGGYGSTGSTY
ncbi:MAG TPA: dUTP diphosphatase [Verrucomicrobia bacterium]|nr:dUTP diphosphatase [Verrucomicrobiota bacterium]